MSTDNMPEKTHIDQNVIAQNGEINNAGRCVRCQTPLKPGKAFCIECGYKNKIHSENKLKLFNNENKNLIIITLSSVAIAVLSVIALVVVLLNQNSSSTEPEQENVKKEIEINFKQKFAEYEGEEWCEFAEDGSWMKIDTNPKDEGITKDIIGLGLYLEMEIPEINKQLGFPDSVNQRMIGTTYNDGLLEEETKDVKMSWRYSDQRGLELLYENK